MTEVLEDSIADLKQSVMQKEDFVANFAHELKTPLTLVIGYADMICQRDLSEKETKEAAQYILEEGLRLEALSLKLMDLIVLNRQEFILEQLPSEELLQGIVKTMLPILEENNIKL